MHREELGRLVRFTVTGTVVAAVYVAAYAGLSSLGMPPFWANLVSFASAVAVQYFGQTMWTFRGRITDGLQGMRFVTTVSLGLAFSTFLTTVVGPFFGWPAWVAAALVAVTLPVTNFIVFRFWVYRIRQTHTGEL